MSDVYGDVAICFAEKQRGGWERWSATIPRGRGTNFIPLPLPVNDTEQ